MTNKLREAPADSKAGTVVNIGEKKAEKAITYLRITPANTDEWVDSVQDATPDYIEAAKETLESLKRIGLKVTLLEIPDSRQIKSKFMICKED